MGRQLRGAMLSHFVRHRLALLMAEERASDLEQLTVQLETGRVVPSLADSYSLARAKEAIQSLEAGKVRGKVVIVPLASDPEDNLTHAA
jgi:NADPH:quinone reductase-like Zn-dependent oxidoreductase